MRTRIAVSAGLMILAVACGAEESSTDEGGAANAGGGESAGGFGAPSGTSTAESEVIDGCAATIAKVEKLPVDVIFVIDNSASMHEEMTQIRLNVNRFADRIAKAGLDYRVIFIVPKANNPRYEGLCVPPPLGKADCGDNAPKFFHVDQNVGSWDSLSIVLSTYEGTATAPGWKRHLRPEATKVFVEVTDDNSRVSAESFDRALLAKPGGMFGSAGERKYVFHSIVSKPSAAKAPTNEYCATSEGPSVEYQKLSLLTGGLIDEVCKKDYSAVLDNLATGVKEKVACELAYPKTEKSQPSHVIVRSSDASQVTKSMTRLTDASKCNQVDDGWYYDNPDSPTKIILCPKPCEIANSTAGVKIEAAVGCLAPPPR